MVTSSYKCVHVFAHVTTHCVEQVQTLKLKKKNDRVLDVADATANDKTNHNNSSMTFSPNPAVCVITVKNVACEPLLLDCTCSILRPELTVN